LHPYKQMVSFGDCDPAGIAFYPNTFRWMDAAFHDFLRDFGGHDQICEGLGAIGIGITNANASFRSPMRDGDTLNVRVTIGTPGQKSFEVSYKGFVDTRLVFEGTETRVLFMNAPHGISAGNIDQLLAILASTGAPSQDRE